MNSERFHTYLARVGGGSPSFRLCLLLLVWSSSLVATVPESMIGNLLKGSEFIGWIMFVLASAGVIETIINDYLPTRFRWAFALRWRHLALMACCGFFLTLIFLQTQSKISNLVLPYFVIVAFFLAWNAFMDIWKRYGPGSHE